MPKLKKKINGSINIQTSLLFYFHHPFVSAKLFSLQHHHLVVYSHHKTTESVRTLTYVYSSSIE